MKKSVYIFVLLLLSVNLWNLNFLSSFLTPDIQLALILLWLAFGILVYRKNHFNAEWERYARPVLFILLGVFLSFLPARVYYGQGLMTSAIAARKMYILAALPCLLYIRPGMKDIKHACYWFSYCYLVVTLLDSLTPWDVTATKANWGSDPVSARHAYIEKPDFVHRLDGMEFLGMAFIFSLNDLSHKRDTSRFLNTFALLAFMFLIQNRTILLASAIVFVFFILQYKGRKQLLWIGFGLFLAVFIALTWEQWAGLFQETQEQLGSDDYNRVAAVTYFVTEACSSWWCYILGNGFLSAKATSHMQDMMELGIYNSDVGFIGLWNQFGIIPIIVLFYCVFRALFQKNICFTVRANALFILACSATHAYFGLVNTVVWLCLFLYMYAFDDMYLIRKGLKEDKK